MATLRDMLYKFLYNQFIGSKIISNNDDVSIDLKDVLSKFTGTDYLSNLLDGGDEFYQGLTTQLTGQNSASQGLMNAAGSYLGNLMTTQGRENDLNREFNAAQSITTGSSIRGGRTGGNGCTGRCSSTLSIRKSRIKSGGA